MPPENDADAIARGDIIADTPAAPEADKAPPAAAAPAEKKETPSSDPSPTPQDGEATPAPAKADAKPDDDAKDDGEQKDHRVPKARFDQAVSKERERAEAAEALLNKYRARERQVAQAANYEESQAKVKEMLKQHSSLLADGDLDKASEVLEDVLQLRDDMNQARSQALADGARDSAKNEMKYDATVERLEAEYPEINPDSEDFDADAVRRVQMMVTGIMQNEGKSSAAALVEATNILLKPTKEAKKDALREKPSEEVVEAGLRRKQEQVDKNIQAAAAQPPSAKDVGKDHDATGGALDAAAVAKMSWEEFMAVPDEELAKMRGDYVN